MVVTGVDGEVVGMLTADAESSSPTETRRLMSVLAAQATCHARGLPHVTLDLREEFRRAVVGPFIRGYAAGETPNPCIRCNGSFRFAELLEFAARAGAERLATGHYARIVRHRGRLLLARATDARKDQSYMLGRLDTRLLGRIWFPLGEQTKEETRAEAASGLGFLGVAVDESRNATAQPDCDISVPGAAVRTLVIAAREDIEIARQTRAALAAG